MPKISRKLRFCKKKNKINIRFFKKTESNFFEKLMTYSGLVSEYIWSKKAKKKTI